MMDFLTEWSPPGLCSIEDGNGDQSGAGGGGGAADDIAAVGGAAAALAGGEQQGGGDGGHGGNGGDGGGQGGEEPDWLQHFSASGGDAENPAPRDWVKSKGFKSLDEFANSYREAEKAIRSGGKISIPDENAKPEEIAAYRAAIGVPETADKYEIKVPDGAEIDAGFVDPMRAIAHEAGVPGGAFSKLADGFIKYQQDQLEVLRKGENEATGEWQKAQGDQVNARMADVNRAAQAIGLSQADIAGMQTGLAFVHGKPGSGRVLDILAKLGAGMAEDAIIGLDGKQRFGVTGAEAQAEIDKLTADPKFRDKLAAKDPEAVARWDRLNAAVAADEERKQRKEQAS